MNDVILKTENICKKFPGVVALDGINFELKKGEVHALLGENGAGKSTFVKILSGAHKKSEGKIFFNGNEIDIVNPKESQNIGISIIYQEFNLVTYLSVAENIFLGREPLKKNGLIDKKLLTEQSRALLEKLEVNIDPSSKVSSLGVAEKQMVEVAKALSLDSKVLIMDEPTSALTEKEIRKLFETVSILKEEGVSIIYISHRLEELFEIADRVTVLRDGTYVGTYDINGTNKDELITLMVNRELKELFPTRTSQPGEEILRIENLSSKNQLKDISLTLHKGEILGIYGLMGAGRSELANAIFGVDKHATGQIYIDKKKAKVKNPGKAIKQGIGFLTEDRKTNGLVLGISVKDNICITNLGKFSKFGVMNAAAEKLTAKKYIDELKIKTFGHQQKVVDLSGGNQQKVVLSKWLCSESKIFIFDEPTRGIDVGAKYEIYQLMNKLTEAGVAIIMISSEMPEILGMSDRILVMRSGSISGEFMNKEATSEKILTKALGN